MDPLPVKQVASILAHKKKRDKLFSRYTSVIISLLQTISEYSSLTLPDIIFGL